MVVADRHRQNGIATAVLQWIENTAAKRGATLVRGVVRDTNQHGIAFAEHQGYAATDAPLTSPGDLTLIKAVDSASAPSARETTR